MVYLPLGFHMALVRAGVVCAVRAELLMCSRKLRHCRNLWLGLAGASWLSGLVVESLADSMNDKVFMSHRGPCQASTVADLHASPALPDGKGSCSPSNGSYLGTHTRHAVSLKCCL